ncbi:MAG TPA: TadE family protein [Dehalococcoidia bacterium]|nr:TadE family protein [Dehalococcoidia bacterium]
MNLKNRTNGEKGQNLVEFAMVVPIFLILVFAIVDFGMGFHAWITVTNAAREGARVGAVGANEATIISKVENTSGSLNDDNMTITVVNPQGSPGDTVEVTVAYDYQMITPLSTLLGLIGGGFGETIDFDATSKMRLE